MEREDIRKFIEEQTLIKIESDKELLFTSGKIGQEFFTYLIIMLEDYFGIAFPDPVLEIENFDSVEKMVKMAKSI
ncbi:hypothetical protein [[Clostridium] polysaccharolyticum]|jgi:hypothetical protein|uniref:Phosphopantetheine attachment site n=1 Tax=[Clostridium] polysaccharolyticum TaxID=29364 RepID=A0A1H9Z7S7_9FIRM|nr:hypothetical protein [[Clostridium] polysaccharolyticum]SES77583.1 hypothetical protein SAMN04487772_10344 [[Clostridium] polysaccharolyticum]